MEGKEARAGGPVVDFTHLQLNFSSCLIFVIDYGQNFLQTTQGPDFHLKNY